MRFRRGLILIITSLLFIGVFSTVIMAKSDFSLTNGIIIAKKDDIISADRMKLKITMKDTNTTTSIFFINVSNAKWKIEDATLLDINNQVVGHYKKNNDSEIQLNINGGINTTFMIPIVAQLTGGDATVAVDGNGTVISDMAPVVFGKTSEGMKVNIIFGDSGDIYATKKLPSIKIEEPVVGYIKDYNGTEIILKIDNSDWKFNYPTYYTAFSEEDIDFSRGFNIGIDRQAVQARQEENGSVLRIRLNGNLLYSPVAPGRITISNVSIIPQKSYIETKGLKINVSDTAKIIQSNGFSYQRGNMELKLSYITISNGILNPSFSPNTNKYRVTLENSAESVFLDGITFNSGESIQGAGVKDLKIGENVFNLDVVNQYGYKNTYTLNITRLGSNTSSSGGSGGGSSSSSTTTTSKTVSQKIIEQLSDTNKQSIKQNFNETMPYTSIGSPLTLVTLKELTNDQFTEAELKEILEKPALLKELGVDINALNTQQTLVPITNVTFTDVEENYWANKSIKKAAALGLVAGMPDGSFAPDQELNMTDTLVFLDRVLLLNNVTEMKLSRSVVEKYITDKEHWGFANMASTASKLSEETLSTLTKLQDKAITRELLAQVLYEITDANLKQVNQSISFKDTKDSPYQKAIDYCIRAGLIYGMSDEEMGPTNELSRAQLMAVLVRLDELLK